MKLTLALINTIMLLLNTTIALLLGVSIVFNFNLLSKKYPMVENATIVKTDNNPQKSFRIPYSLQDSSYALGQSINKTPPATLKPTALSLPQADALSDKQALNLLINLEFRNTELLKNLITLHAKFIEQLESSLVRIGELEKHISQSGKQL